MRYYTFFTENMTRKMQQLIMINAHDNNNLHVHNNIPDVIELTYVNKKYFNSVPPLNKQPLPIPNVDFPNNNAQDINLNFYLFVNHDN
jgi:hypothetical protein